MLHTFGYFLKNFLFVSISNEQGSFSTTLTHTETRLLQKAYFIYRTVTKYSNKWIVTIVKSFGSNDILVNTVRNL